MTIERQWLEIFKSEVPEAFSDDAPFPCEVGFIDAQIKLMAMPHEHDWDVFLQKQFRNPVTSMFALGARTVVLAFDDYDHVPRAKAITQAKRRDKLTPLRYGEGDAWPVEPPQPWNAAMANRAFKSSVVAYVIQNIPMLFCDLPDGLDIVVDWRGPTLLRFRAKEFHEEPRQPVGEADLKFLHWAKQCEVPMAAEAIDGDFVPIALASGCAKLAIQRYKVLRTANEPCRYEWVNVDVLRAGMERAMRQTALCVRVPWVPWPAWELHCLLALVGLTGTDYSRGLPLVGPKKVWNMLPRVLGTMLGCCLSSPDRSGGTPMLDPGNFATDLMAAIYANAFAAHVPAPPKHYGGVAAAIRKSKLSEYTKASLPSQERAMCSARNVNFVLAYWLGKPVDSMHPSFGFREAEGGVVQWDD